MVDRAAVDEEESGRDPEAEGEGRAELREQVVSADVLAQGADVFDRCEAALAGGEGGREDRRARGWVGGGGVEADDGAVGLRLEVRFGGS